MKAVLEWAPRYVGRYMVMKVGNETRVIRATEGDRLYTVSVPEWIGQHLEAYAA